MTQEIIEKPMSAECTMKQYEAIPDADFVENREYQLTDYPDNGANADQMAFALTCQRLFPAGTAVTFSGTTDDNYTNGHLYQIEVDDSGSKSWKDITPAGEQSIVVLVGTEENPITPDMLDDDTKLYLLKGYIRIVESGASDTTDKNLGGSTILANVRGNSLKQYMFYNTIYSINLHLFVSNSIASGMTAYRLIKNEKVGFGNFASGWSVKNLNNKNDWGNSGVSFYAPTTSGTANQILQSNGANNAPTWIDNTAPFVLDITDLTAKISDDNLTKLQNNKVAYINYTQTDSYTTKIYLYRKVSYYNTSIDSISYLRFVLMNNTNDDLSGVNEYLDVYLKTSLDGENPPEKGQIVQSSQKTLLTPSGTPTNGQVPVVKDNKLTWADMPTSTVDTELADSENPVQNKAIFNALKDKLGVLGPDEHNRVYIRKDNTTDSSLPFSYTAEADSIMKRNASGQVQVATPTQDDDAVNKSYADQLQRYLSLSGDSGVLEDEQYELVKNNDNLIIQRVGLDFRRCGYPSNGQGDYIFFCDHYTKPNGSEDWLDYFITIKQDKTWETTIKNHLQVAGQSYTPFVQLTPDTATQGNLSDDDYTNLTEHDDVYIILNNEYYRKADNQHTTGIISYTHQGWNGDTPQDKSINITVSTKAWTLVVGKTKYYRHYVQLTADNKALYYDFSSTQETAYTADTLPSMPDDIITTFQVVANGYYSTVSGLVYRNSENELKVIMHGMYTTDGTNMSYLQLTGVAATFVQDVVKTM